MEDIEQHIRNIIISQINNVGLIELGRLKYLINLYLDSLEDFYFYPVKIFEDGVLEISGYEISTRIKHHIVGNVKTVISEKLNEQ